VASIALAPIVRKPCDSDRAAPSKFQENNLKTRGSLRGCARSILEITMPSLTSIGRIPTDETCRGHVKSRACHQSKAVSRSIIHKASRASRATRTSSVCASWCSINPQRLLILKTQLLLDVPSPATLFWLAGLWARTAPSSKVSKTVNV
jgi:hypothetical protein